ncbi:MAG TPA: CDP-glucose 4,6-dehydratase [Bryobacteraceae bacterium]|jgi:CDP-glucose 4,6-dehydratase|nr:CDP-glucose 4,6-dehydratase [Bryobacteraceae bacterium]
MNWSGKRVFLTGHTGFKGGWMALWLQLQGCEVCGYSLLPSTRINLFEDASVGRDMRSMIGDVRDAGLLCSALAGFRPEVVFHFAAQPLVRSSYRDPLGTYSTNVMGTANLFEAVRHTDSVRAVVVVTSDKCYENREWDWSYREIDRLGGYDPYSSSKACAELILSAYRNSFFNPADYRSHGVALASVRAGNVIGGGDWAEDRLIPDIIRAFTVGDPVRIRNPRAIRPWQHVLEPLRGYLAVAESLCESGIRHEESWNFGPDPSDAQSVEWVLWQLSAAWGDGARWELENASQPHEDQNLTLDCSRAATQLRWRPQIGLRQALEMTVDWYRARLQGQEMRAFTCKQIRQYANLATAKAASSQSSP